MSKTTVAFTRDGDILTFLHDCCTPLTKFPFLSHSCTTMSDNGTFNYSDTYDYDYNDTCDDDASSDFIGSMGLTVLCYVLFCVGILGMFLTIFPYQFYVTQHL